METKGPSRDNCGSYYKVGLLHSLGQSSWTENQPPPCSKPQAESQATGNFIETNTPHLYLDATRQLVTLAQIVFTKHVELDDCAFLFADYSQLHTGVVFCQVCLLIQITASSSARKDQVLCFLFPACHGLTLSSNTITNYWETEMKKRRIQKCKPFFWFYGTNMK